MTENSKPWLIEINSGPDLKPTTKVTAEMCPEVIADSIKGITIAHESTLAWYKTSRKKDYSQRLVQASSYWIHLPSCAFVDLVYGHFWLVPDTARVCKLGITGHTSG